MAIENEQELASVGSLAVQVTVDVPIGNGVPETGEHDALSTGSPATVGRFQVIRIPSPSSDCRATGGGQDMRVAVGVPDIEGVGAVGESLPPQLAVTPVSRTVRMSAAPRSRTAMISSVVSLSVGGTGGAAPVGSSVSPSSGVAAAALQAGQIGQDAIGVFPESGRWPVDRGRRS